MFTLTRLLSHIPDVLKMAEAAGRAAQGDEDAQKYLREDAGFDALDLLMHRGAGGAARGIVEGAKMLINGEASELAEGGRYPWSGFIKRLLAQKSGGHILLGTMGTGKTQLAIKLASNWQARGFEPEFCALYPDDVPDFGKTIHIETVVKRMQGLSAYLKSQASPDDDETDDYVPPEEIRWHFELEKTKRGSKAKPQLPPARRVVVIDEAGLVLTSSAQDPARRAALQYVAQSRHCASQVLFLGQTATQIPLPLLGQSVCWLKKPLGDEAETDRDNPLVQLLWEKAAEAFRGLGRSPYFVPPYQDVRSWAYVYALGLRYRGLVPWTPYQGQGSRGKGHDEGSRVKGQGSRERGKEAQDVA